MRERDRLLATGVIWTAYMVILGLLFVFGTGPASGLYGDAVFGIVLVTSVAAVSTHAVWDKASSGAATGVGEAADARKAKRLDRRRIERLIEGLDDDEIVELETLLMSHQEDVYP